MNKIYKFLALTWHRFICIMKRHPGKVLLHIYPFKETKDDDLVVAEYHCDLCNLTFLEQKKYSDVKLPSHQ